MREIKSRAWCTEAGRMIEEPYHFDLYFYSDENRVNRKSWRCYEDWRDLEDGRGLECERMEFIGLQDKNKKDIWEGDIGEIKTKGGRIERFTVEWGVHRRKMASGWTVDIPGYCFRIEGFPSFPIVENYLNGHDLDIIEIIGNIYENPELIPSKK